jgi:CBS domain-containing protein
MTAARVRDLMHSGLITCRGSASIGEVAAVLVERGIHAVAVIDEKGGVVGILSDFDLLAGEWLSVDQATLERMKAMRADELMTFPPVTIDVDATAAEAAALLDRERISRLVVTEHGDPIGMITISDLVATIGRAPSERRTVADVMSQAIVVCRSEAPVHAVARAMHERRSRSVVVVDGEGRAVGVVTGRDLLQAYASADADRAAADLMHAPLTVSPDTSLREAADLMLEHEVHRLVVIDPSAQGSLPIGLISTSDVVAEMAEATSAWQA